jgi:hypothetical protein
MQGTCSEALLTEASKAYVNGGSAVHLTTSRSVRNFLQVSHYESHSHLLHPCTWGQVGAA